MPSFSLDQRDQGHLPVTTKATDYLAGYVSTPHHHPTAQLIHAASGVMVVNTHIGHWVVPPTRAIWMPAGCEHWVRMVTPVQMRTIYIRLDTRPDLPTGCRVVSVSPLLRELLLAAMDVPLPYAIDSRDGRLMQLILDEVALLPTLPLHLPMPHDARLRALCEQLLAAPDDNATLTDWGERLGIDGRTVQRLFARETGMRFGQWRQQARLLAGLEQLAGGSKIVDVALNLGYQSPSAFAAMFKRQFGETPSGYFR